MLSVCARFLLRRYQDRLRSPPPFACPLPARTIDGYDMEKFGTVDSSEKTSAIPGDSSSIDDQRGRRYGIHFFM